MKEMGVFCLPLTDRSASASNCFTSTRYVAGVTLQLDDAPVGLSACLGAICLTGGGALLIGAYARGAKDLGRFLHDPTAEIVFVLPISVGKWRIPIGWCHRDGDRC